MPTYDAGKLSDPNTQFTQVQARERADARSGIINSVVQAGTAAGGLYAKNQGEELTGANISDEQALADAKTINENIANAFTDAQVANGGTLQPHEVRAVVDQELERFGTNDKTLKTLHQMGTISSIEARARRTLNLQRALSNPINAMFKNKFMDAAADLTGGSSGAYKTMFPETPEEIKAKAMEEGRNKVRAEEEGLVTKLVEYTGMSVERARKEIQEQNLDSIEVVRTERKVREQKANSEEFNTYLGSKKNVVTRKYALDIQGFAKQNNGMLDTNAMSTLSQNLSKDYLTLVEAINSEGGKLSPAQKDEEIKRLDAWKSGVETLIGSYSQAAFDKAKIDEINTTAEKLGWATMPEMMFLQKNAPEAAKAFVASGGNLFDSYDRLMGAGSAASIREAGDYLRNLASFSSGENVNKPEGYLSSFKTKEGAEYIADKAETNPEFKNNLRQAYMNSPETSMRLFNEPSYIMGATKSPTLRNEVQAAMSIARDKFDFEKKHYGAEGEFIQVSQTDAPMPGRSAKARGQRKLEVNIPNDLRKYAPDVFQMHKAFVNNPWTWKHVEGEYLDATDAFNGYLRGEFDVNTDTEVSQPVDRRGRDKKVDTPAVQVPSDAGLIRQSDREELMQLLRDEEQGNTVDEERLATLLEQRIAIRDRTRSSSGVTPPDAMRMAEAVKNAPESQLSAKSTARQGEFPEANMLNSVKDMIAGVETSFGANDAKAYSQGKNSSGYEGKYQFRYRDSKDAGWDIAVALGIDPKAPKSPEEQEAIMDEYLRRNSESLSKKGIEVTPYNLWLAHNQGVAGANAILTGKLTDTIRRNIKNQGVKGNTDAELIANYHNKFQSKFVGKP